MSPLRLVSLSQQRLQWLSRSRWRLVSLTQPRLQSPSLKASA